MDRELDHDNYVCFYCGAIANSIDHVIPQSLIRHLNDIGDLKLKALVLRHRILSVPACMECNALASNTVQMSLADRKKLIKNKLRHRYKRIMDIPEWSDSELATMSKTMQQFILSGLLKRDYIKKRLTY